MAATLDIEPVTPAAAYRPLYFGALRSDPAGSEVLDIIVADSTEAAALGCEVGQVVVEHATIIGPVAALAGQTVNLYRGCGQYNGIHTILQDDISYGGSLWMVIDAPDLGAFTPSGSPTAALRIWLNNYTVVCQVSIFTDPSLDPVLVYMEGTPDNGLLTGFYVDKVIRDYFDNNIEPFAKAIPFGLAQNAHGVTALFYKVAFAEVYDSPGEIVTDPFDGGEYVGSEVFFTDTDYRVAVNAVHPASEITEAIVPSTPTVLDWSTEGLNGFQVGGTLWERRFLTLSPRRQRVMSTDYYRLHMLTSDVDNGDALKYTVDYTLRVYDFTNGTLLIGDIILQEPIALAGITTAAFSIGVGPADLAGFVTLPAKYAVMITNDNTGAFSEIFAFEVDSDCKEVKRSIAFLNPLGGVDSYTFTARELENANEGQGVYTVSARGLNSRERKWLVNGLLRRGDTKTLSKYYDPGTGYDYTERPYSGCIAVTRMSDTIVAPVIIETTKALASSTGGYNGPLTIDFRIGRDQTSQQG